MGNQLSREAIGQSESFLDFQERLSKVAPVERPVLLMGEEQVKSLVLNGCIFSLNVGTGRL